MTRATRVLIVLLSILSIIFVSMTMFILMNRLAYKESYAYIPHQEVLTDEMTFDEAKQYIDQLNSKTFKIKYVDDAYYDGQVKFCAVFDNTIYINSSITADLPRLIWTYAHESVHATAYCLDERKTQYLTFILLYESGNDYLKEVALYTASNMINNAYKEYDATYYIAEYLNSK